MGLCNPLAALSLLTLIGNSWSFLLQPGIQQFQRVNIRSNDRTNEGLLVGRSIALSLFSINSNGRATGNSTKNSSPSIPTKREGDLKLVDQGEHVEKELSIWVEGLRQWPLYPTPSSSMMDSNSDKSKEENEEAIDRDWRTSSARSSARYRGSNPLTNLNGILALANRTGSSDESIFGLADQLIRTVTDSIQSEENNKKIVENKSDMLKSVSTATTVEELLEGERWLESLQRSIGVGIPFEAFPNSNVSLSANESFSEGLARLSFTQANAIASTAEATPQPSLGETAESIIRDATSRIEYLVNEASSALSPDSVQDLIDKTSQLFFSSNETSADTITNDIVQAAGSIAKNQGLDVGFAQEQARETANYAANLVDVANSLFAAGYAYGSESYSDGSSQSLLDSTVDSQVDVLQAKPLFAKYASARRVESFQYNSVVMKGAEMGSLAGAIYEDTLRRCHAIGHSLVANGTSAEVAWMVTDSLDKTSKYDELTEGSHADEAPIFVRTITIRGFDASDDTVDRERLLNTICSPVPERISEKYADVSFHSGLLSVAREVYADVKKYIEWAPPNQKIVLNGHSIGGSLSILLLFLITTEYGAVYTKDRVLRVYTHGSPPIATAGTNYQKSSGLNSCPILELFGLPSDIVFGYVQPYDPIVRFMTEYDPLYPLVDDLGSDEITLYASGPRRSLRPLTRVIFSSWEGWPEFRENWKSTNPRSQRFQAVGLQHLLLPQIQRYLSDRFVSTNVGVPPTDAIVRIAPTEMLMALNATFPMDVFQISLLPQAVRSFLHHFYPAYDSSIENYASKVERKQLFAQSQRTTRK